MDNDNVKLSISRLYRQCGTLAEDNIFVSDDGYFDLYNRNGDLCCMDGEDVFVINHENGSYLLKNINGDKDVYFILSDKEFEAARMD